jgi:hypothetical protein
MAKKTRLFAIARRGPPWLSLIDRQYADEIPPLDVILFSSELFCQVSI